MDTKDPVTEKTELIIDALAYAHEHNLDINDRDDVKKVLEGVNASNEDIDVFMNLLQNADVFMEMKAKEKESGKTDLPN